MSQHADNQADAATDTLLGGLRILELSDELGEYCGRLLAGLGAEVLKVEPPAGEITRTYGPFLDDRPGPDRSLHFWHYNLGKRSTCLDLNTEAGRVTVRELAGQADVVLTSRSPGQMRAWGLDQDSLLRLNPALVYARISPFGDDGPWQAYRGSDLVHLALGGVAMNCGYDPDPSGRYDTPPIAPQMWMSYQITGEMMAFAILAALSYCRETGTGQYVSSSVHDAVSKNTENDVPNWIYLGKEHVRQTCRHSNPTLSPPVICASKDGRWHLPYRTYMTSAMKNDVPNTARLLGEYGMAGDLADPRYDDPEYVKQAAVAAHVSHVIDDFFSRIRAEVPIWTRAQQLGLPWSPIRQPEENIEDPHWAKRGTFVDVEHPDLGRSFVDVGQKWVSTIPWRQGMRAPVLGAASPEWTDCPRPGAAVRATTRGRTPAGELTSWRGAPFALSGVRIVDLSWLLASGGAGRFFAALGAEVIKVEHHARLDHMRSSWVGRVPITPAEATAGARPVNRSGTFMEINAGKLSVGLDLKQEEGYHLLLDLVRNADLVLSGFSPGTMTRLGLGYNVLRQVNPAIVSIEQSAVGDVGTYGPIRGYGPTAQALSGLSEMSGLPQSFPPAGIGYSFLDWYGAYNMATAAMAGLHHARTTGVGCHIDASQVEAGIYLTGSAILDRSANGRPWHRYGNRSPYKQAAPHGIYRASGDDRWIAISCFSDDEWHALARQLERPEWLDDERFRTLPARLAHQDALDALVEAATAQEDAYALMDALQAAGVAAGVCQTARDRCENDPQLAHGGWLVDLPQTEIGTWPVKEAPFTMSATPPAIGGRLRRSGPNYGEDTEYVLSSVLGLSAERIRQLTESGVVSG
jgi:crotonobetainyl-CoA:carnitine CoA-transferase CaiB-like acyl-CoA transferase